MDKVKVGIIGSQFVAGIHAESFKSVADADVVAAASPNEGHVSAFAEKHGIPNRFTDYRQMVEMDELDMVTLCLPNYLHCEATVAAAEAGKHVLCEKPLCMNLAEADRMIDACNQANVKLMYAEELCFAPKYVRAKQLIDAGAIGKVHLLKQSEKHDGPHADWFWDVELSGGGVTVDMGCHAFEFFRWLLDKPKALSVYADMATHVHAERTRGDDVATIIVNFEGGARGLAEESWAKKGGMDDRAEMHGSEGVIYANLLQGSSLLTYSAVGYDYAVEKAASTVGWTFTMYEELWNYGFPQEMAHFVKCVKEDLEPLETGEDARAVLEMIFAAYASAGTGRKVELPFRTDAARPIDLWR